MRVKFRHRARLNIRCALTVIFKFPCVNWILRFISVNTVWTNKEVQGLQVLFICAYFYDIAKCLMHPCDPSIVPH